MDGYWGGWAALALLAVAAQVTITGCASERSFPIAPQHVVAVATELPAAPETTRAWLKTAQGQLAHLFPASHAAPLLTADLTGANGRPVDVFSHFGIEANHLSSFWYNPDGILDSAQVTGERFGPEAPPWPGFEEVWIPINPSLQLSGRLGLARHGGQPVYTDCIVLLAGLFGDNSTLRSRDVAAALRDAGLHVLSLEQRGHGRTEARCPQTPYTFGAMETGDLLAVSRWLEARPEVRDTGLIGFCWGANTALLAAWEDGRAEDDSGVPPGIRPYLQARGGRVCFRAGVMAVSPAVQFEALIDRLDRRWTILSDPVAAALGDIVDRRARQKGYRTLHGNLRSLLRIEVQRAAPAHPGFYEDGIEYVRLLPAAAASGTKLDAARMPVLVVHAADDPVGAAQPVADLMSRVHNPNVAAIILPGGGHCGFAPHARDYFYSLILSFFDRRQGAAACLQRRFASFPQRATAETR